jgi:Flp pilus assembly protein TadB
MTEQPTSKPAFQFTITGKNEPHKVVQMNMSKTQVESLGYSRHMKKTASKFVLIFVILLVLSIAGSLWQWSSPIVVAFLFAALMLWVYWATMCTSAGKRLWREIKDKDEPVSLS